MKRQKCSCKPEDRTQTIGSAGCGIQCKIKAQAQSSGNRNFLDQVNVGSSREGQEVQSSQVDGQGPGQETRSRFPRRIEDTKLQGDG